MAAVLAGFTAALATIGAFLPKLLGFIVVLIVGYVIAKIFEAVVRGILHRVGFNNLVERGGVKEALSRSKYDASELLGKVAEWIIILFALQMAFGVFGPNPVSSVIAAAIAYLPRVFAAGVIIVIGAAVAAFLRDVVAAAMARTTWGEVVATVTAVAVWFVTVVAALDELLIAPAIVSGLFYAALATVVGISVVAVGGGGIQTMRKWWERASGTIEAQTPVMSEQMQGAGERAKQTTEEKQRQAREAMQPKPEEREPVGAAPGNNRRGNNNRRS